MEEEEEEEEAGAGEECLLPRCVPWAQAGRGRGWGAAYHVEALEDDPVARADDLGDQALLAGVLAAQDLHLRGREEAEGRQGGGRGGLPGGRGRGGAGLTVSPWKTCQRLSSMGSTGTGLRRWPGGLRSLSAMEPGRFMP